MNNFPSRLDYQLSLCHVLTMGLSNKALAMITPYDEGFDAGWSRNPQINPYDKGLGGTPEVMLIAGQWEKGYRDGILQREAEELYDRRREATRSYPED
jgi:hypothetical protein